MHAGLGIEAVSQASQNLGSKSVGPELGFKDRGYGDGAPPLRCKTQAQGSTNTMEFEFVDFGAISAL